MTTLHCMRRLSGLVLILLLAVVPGMAQPFGSWQVHPGPDTPHAFGMTVDNGQFYGYLNGASIPPASDAGWASASSDLSLRWTGGQVVPCRAAADYAYFQTAVVPAPGDRYAFSFVNVDDAARITVFNEQNPSGMDVPNSIVGLREQKTIDVTSALMAGAMNRVVITLANVCGPTGTLQLRAEVEQREAEEGGGVTLPLAAAHSFTRGERLYNAGGDHFLVLNPDGNLVIARADGGYVWGFDTQPNVDHTRVGRVDWQPDGNLAAYDRNGQYLWSALTQNPDPAGRLVLQPNGALQIVSATRGVLWSSNGDLSAVRAADVRQAPAAPSPSPARSEPEPMELEQEEPEEPVEPTASSEPTTGTSFPFAAGQGLERGTTYPSSSGNHTATLQADGNLVIARSGGGYIWGFDQVREIDRSRVRGLRILPDGNLAAVDADGAPVWRALRSGADPAARLVLTSAGALQLVSPSRGVQWSSDGILATTVDVFSVRPPARSCTPAEGWAKCLELNDPTIKIQGTNRVSDSAMNAVANVYAEITARLTDRYPRNDFDGFGVYITNGESLAELNALDPIKGVHADGYPGTDGSGGGTRNMLRGGACCDGPVGSGDYVWISEQMICKAGVATRNDDISRGRVRGERDETYRSFDQVIHEFGHSIDQKYGLRPTRLPSLYRGNPTEPFAQSIQSFFAAPPIPQTDAQMAFLNELFSSRVRFSCEGYAP